MKKSTMFMREIVLSLARRRSRMLVALLSVAIGATILSGLITLYRDVPRQLSEEFRSYGANMIFTPSSGLAGFALTDLGKVDAMIEQDDVVGVTPFSYHNIRINELPFMVCGTDFASVKKTAPYWHVEGDYPESERGILVGANVALKLGCTPGSSLILHDDNNSDGVSFEVSGVLETGGSEEDYIYAPFEALPRLKIDSGRADLAQASLRLESEELQALADRVNAAAIGISAKLVTKVAKSEETVLTKLRGLVYVVTVVVLILTMVCVSTTMMAVVTERRKEVGLRKALGASNADIIRLFMGESVLLGLLGGVLGMILGYYFARFVSLRVFARAAEIEPYMMVCTVVISVVITALACVLPVRSATTVDPAKVLKGE